MKLGDGVEQAIHVAAFLAGMPEGAVSSGAVGVSRRRTWPSTASGSAPWRSSLLMKISAGTPIRRNARQINTDCG